MTQRIKTWIPAAAFAAMLAACGGGQPQDEAPAPASAQMVQSFNAIADYCGLGVTLPYDGEQVLDTFLSAKVRRYGTQDAQAVAARTGWEPFDAADVSDIAVDLHDLRSVSGQYLSKGGGLATAGVRMGLHFPSALPSGGVVCVAPVSWLRPIPGSLYSSLAWASLDSDPLPVDRLGATPIDGFELVANFAIPGGQVYFIALKSMVADPARVRVCRLDGASTSWSCSAPAVADRTDRWLFTVQAADRGAWVLASTEATPGK